MTFLFIEIQCSGHNQVQVRRAQVHSNPSHLNCIFFLCLKCSFIHRLSRPEDGSGPSERLRQAAAQAESLCARLHLRAGFSYFPLHELYRLWGEHLGQTGRIWRRKDHCDWECCQNKVELRGTALFLKPHTKKKGKERTVHSTFPVTMSHRKWSILYLFFYTCSKFLSPRSNKSYLFGGGFSQNDEWIWSLHILSFVNIWRYPELKTKSIIVTCELSGDSL